MYLLANNVKKRKKEERISLSPISDKMLHTDAKALICPKLGSNMKDGIKDTLCSKCSLFSFMREPIK